MRCLQQSLPPQAGTACPLPCAMSPQTAEEPSHLDTARPARLLPAIQRAPSWEPRSPGGGLNSPLEAPDAIPSGLWAGTGEDIHAWMQPRCCHPSIPFWGHGQLSLRLKKPLLSAGRRFPSTTGPQEVLDPKGVPELQGALGQVRQRTAPAAGTSSSTLLSAPAPPQAAPDKIFLTI